MSQSDTTEVEPLPKKFLQPFVYVDYGKLLTVWTDFETKYEAGFGLLFFEHFELTGEWGRGELEPPGAYPNSDYKSTGNYFRVGFGHIWKFDLKNNIGLGARYGISNFEDQLTYRIEGSSGLSSPVIESLTREDLSARWWEIAIITDTKISLNKENPESKLNNLFRVGAQIRYRVLIDYDKLSPIDAYSIPGYGRTIDKSIPAFNLYIKVYPF